MDARKLTRWSRAALVAGPVCAVALAAATSRGDSAPALANVALATGFIVVMAAGAGPAAGLLTSVVGAVALNYFHTEPRNSFRIESGSDVLTLGLLLALGFAAAAHSSWRLRREVTSAATVRSEAAAESLVRELNHGVPAEAAWHGAVSAVSGDMALLKVSMVGRDDRQYPVVSRVGPRSFDETGRVVIPASGAIVEMSDPRLGRAILLSPHENAPSVTVDRRSLMALVSQLELACRESVTAG